MHVNKHFVWSQHTHPRATQSSEALPMPRELMALGSVRRASSVPPKPRTNIGDEGQTEGDLVRLPARMQYSAARYFSLKDWLHANSFNIIVPM